MRLVLILLLLLRSDWGRMVWSSVDDVTSGLAIDARYDVARGLTQARCWAADAAASASC
jgi:hypothetical protein